MRILIIGGAGFTGPHVVRSLVSTGHEVTLFHRSRGPNDLPTGVPSIFGDRENLSDFADQLRECDPQVVLDMIPVTQQDAETVVDMFGDTAERVVAISSQDVYRAYGMLIGIESGPIELMPVTEESPLRSKLYPFRDQSEPGQRLYDYDKILVERAFMSNPELPGTILRYPMVYGPGDLQHRLCKYLKRMDDKRPAIILEEGMAEWRCTRGFVENMAEAVVMAVTNERAAGRTYNVGDAENLTEAEWIRAIGDAIGWNGQVVTISGDRLPQHLKAGIDFGQHFVCDSGRIRRELGYDELIPRDEALRRTVVSERQNPPRLIRQEHFDYNTEDQLLAELDVRRG